MNDTLARYRQLQREIARLGPVAAGGVRQVYVKCGKSYCACANDPAKRHGPYFFWDRRGHGRRKTSKSVTPAQAEVLLRWIANRDKLQEITDHMLQLADDFLAELK